MRDMMCIGQVWPLVGAGFLSPCLSINFALVLELPWKKDVKHSNVIRNKDK